MRWNELKDLIRTQIDQEFASGYPTLRRIPSSHTWSHLAAIDLLGSDERSILFDLLAERGCQGFETEIDSAEWQRRYDELRKNAVLEHYHNSIASQQPWKYADPRYLRKCLDSWRRFHPAEPVKHHLRSGRGAVRHQAATVPDFSPIPLPVIEAAEQPKKCTAAQIRAAVKRAFADRFKMKQINAKYGNWEYPGEFDGRAFTLVLSWTWMGGPNYGLEIGRHECGLNPPAWENVLGFGIGSWDFVCEHNLSDSIDLLGEIIERAVATLPTTRRFHS